MNFGAPSNLWWLLGAVVFWILVLVGRNQSDRARALFSSSTLFTRLAPGFWSHGKLVRAALWSAAFVFAVIAAARPQYGKSEETVKTSGFDLILTIDVSNSMEVEDAVPTRLKRVKKFIRSLAQELNGDRVGVVAFAGSSFVSCPLTNDLGYALESIEMLSPKSIANQGTDIGSALDVSLSALQGAAEDLSPVGSRAIALFTDGEDFEGKAQKAAEKVKQSGARLFIFGVGTEKGGPIPVRDDQGQLRGYKKDRSGQTVLSKFQAQGLSDLASVGGGSYFHISNDETELSQFLTELRGLERADHAEKKIVTLKERYQIPLAIAVFLFFVELFIPVRKRVVTLVLLVAIGLLNPQGANAQEKASEKTNRLSQYWKNRQAVKDSEAGKNKEALSKLEEAGASETQDAKLKFNYGTALAADGKFKESVEALKSAAESATKAKDPAVEARSAFNLGAVAQNQKQNEEALQAYMNAIDAAKRAKDPALELDARKNLELLQQQEQQQNKSGSDDDQKQEQKQQDDQNQNEKDKEGQKKQFQDPSKGKRKYDSKKLGQEEAKRVLEQLSAKEKELKEKLNRAKGARTDNDQDW